MPDLKDIKAAANQTDAWLKKRQKKHVKMVENSIKKLQDSIVDNLGLLETSNGRLKDIKVNLKQSQKLHTKIETLFATEFNESTRKIIADFKKVKEPLIRSYGILDEAVDFTSVDDDMMTVLREGYYQDYLNLGAQYKDKVVQSVYDNVLANGRIADLANVIEGTLLGVGATDALGRSLAQYSRLYANDMIMNFHNQVNLKKAEDLGMDRFLYYGTLISKSRKFCRQRAGKVYTKDQIQSWKYKWAGKAGPAMTHRGGYNCRHHWQPVRKKWVEGTSLEQGGKQVPEFKPVELTLEQQNVINLSEYHSIDNYDDFLIKAAKEKRGLDLNKEQIRRLSKNFEDNLDIHINAPLSRKDEMYDDLLENGKFKNQFELGENARSGGAFAPYKGGSRDKWERAFSKGNFQSSPAYSNIDEGALLPDDLAKQRPIYGYASDKMAGNGARLNGRYGEVTFKLKKETKKRMTLFTNNTSGFDSTVDQLSSPKNNAELLYNIIQNDKISDKHLMSMVSGKKGPSGFTKNIYTESQIYGGLSIERDISEIIVMGDMPHIKQLAKKWNVKYKIVPFGELRIK